MKLALVSVGGMLVALFLISGCGTTPADVNRRLDQIQARLDGARDQIAGIQADRQSRGVPAEAPLSADEWLKIAGGILVGGPLLTGGGVMAWRNRTRARAIDRAKARISASKGPDSAPPAPAGAPGLTG